MTQESYSLEKIPRDGALPQMRSLLDVEAMAPVLERSLGRNGSIAAIRIGYVRYKPARSLSVRYEVTIGDGIHDVVTVADVNTDLAGRAEKPENMALARKVEGRTPAERPLAHDPELDILVQWMPLDLALPAMAEPPARLLQLLEEAGVQARGSRRAADARQPQARSARRPALRRPLHQDLCGAGGFRARSRGPTVRRVAALPYASLRGDHS